MPKEAKGEVQKPQKPKTLEEKQQYYLNILNGDRQRLAQLEQQKREIAMNINRIEGALIIIEEMIKEQNEVQPEMEVVQDVKTPSKNTAKKAAKTN
jgi:hypothetical protein